jgi:hypothetical protein
MLNSGNKIRALREKNFYYPRVVRKILNETKNHIQSQDITIGVI